MEENEYMIMDDTNNIYDWDEIPEISPELEIESRAETRRMFSEAKRKRIESEAAQSYEVAFG